MEKDIHEGGDDNDSVWMNISLINECSAKLKTNHKKKYIIRCGGGVRLWCETIQRYTD